MSDKIILIILIILLCFIIYKYNKYNKNTDKNTDEIIKTNKINNTYNKERFFAQQYDPNNDGNMKFNYLVSPNYTTNILSRY